jgi:glycosyltransferase involved in cell wall biosynthesis
MHRRQGINIYGYVYAEHGVGEAARLVIECARQAGLGYAVIPYTMTGSRQDAAVDDLGGSDAVYDINVIIVNADSLPAFVDHFGPQVLEGRYNIGIWAWEIETLPDELACSARFLDEIWAISRFTADAIARSVSCPVLTFPLTNSVRPVPARPRTELGLTDDFLFLFCFDFNSLFDRKNPLALIDAFDRAFPTGEGAQLVIKTLNGREFSDQLERLNAAALDNPKIRIVDGYLSLDEQRVLIASCDAYVSLHRSEGFGLTLLEAMAYGKPVIATGYSGNLDFMSERNGYLVPYRMVPLPESCGPYPASARWAEPDVDVAAELMRRVVEHPDEAREKGRIAKQDVESLHTPQARARLIVDRLDIIRAKLDDQPQRPIAAQPRVPVERGDEASRSAAPRPPEPSLCPFTAYDTVKDLLDAQLVRFDPDRLVDGLACGSLDGGMLDAAGGASIWGWAYDPRTMQPARSVILFLNGRQIAVQIPVGSERPDVASFLGNRDLSASGWSLYLPPRCLARGRNAFVAYAVLPDRRLGALASHRGEELVLDTRSLWNFAARLRRRA